MRCDNNALSAYATIEFLETKIEKLFENKLMHEQKIDNNYRFCFSELVLKHIASRFSLMYTIIHIIYHHGGKNKTKQKTLRCA